jgi:hypothetical protein
MTRSFSSAPARIRVLALFAFFALPFLGCSLVGQEVGFSAFEGITVGTADRTDVSRLTDAGVVGVGNAGGIVVTLTGELRARADRDGVIGVLLLPEVPFFNNLYRNRKILLSVADATASIAAGDSSFFVSKPKRIEAGFPQYHLYLFNTTGALATVSVYVNPTKI